MYNTISNQHTSSGDHSAMFHWFLSPLFCLLVAFFVSVRVPELTTVLATDVTGTFVIALSFVGCLSLFTFPAKSTWLYIRRLALITLAIAYVKQRLDHDIKLSITSADLSDHVAIVTGANGGTGFAVAKLLVSLGSTVVLACRNEGKCTTAAQSIQELYPMKRKLVVAMTLDLNDLNSVRAFSKEFLRTFKRLDILVNNAGIIAPPGSTTAQGLEQSFGAMHIGHFALTKYLLKLLLKPVPGGKGLHEAARVINLSADALFAGNFHPSLMTGSGAGDLMMEITDNCGVLQSAVGPIECCPFLSCPNTNGYARAKLANAMHAYELQRRVDEYILQHSSGGAGPSKAYRRVVTASLHPGSVSTNIHGFLSAPAMALFLRSPDQAAHILLHAILDDAFVPSAYIDAMRVSHDLFGFRANHLHKHLAAFPMTRHLPYFSDKTASERFTLHDYLWSRQAVIWPSVEPAALQGQLQPAGEALDSRLLFRKDTVAARLWDVSEQIVSDWEARRPILQSNVSIAVSNRLVI